MSRLLSGLLVGMTTLALSGAVMAAEQTHARPIDPAAHAAGGATAGASANAGADADVGRSPEYNAELQKCDAMTGAAKTRCVMAAEKKHSASENQRDTTGRADENASGNAAYSADLQKCDALGGTEKTSCMSAARRKHGHM